MTNYIYQCGNHTLIELDEFKLGSDGKLDLCRYKPSMVYKEIIAFDSINRVSKYISLNRVTSVEIPKGFDKIYFLIKSNNNFILNLEYEEIQIISAIYLLYLIERERWTEADKWMYVVSDRELINEYIAAYGWTKIDKLKSRLLKIINREIILDSKVTFPRIKSKSYCVVDFICDLTKLDVEIDLKGLKAKYRRVGPKVQLNTPPGLIYECNEEFAKPYNISYNSNRLNLGIDVSIPVEITLPRNSVGLDKVNSFMYRTYNLITDGVPNVGYLTVVDLQYCRMELMTLTEKVPCSYDGHRYTFYFSQLPLISRSMKLPDLHSMALMQLELIIKSIELKYLKFIKDCLPSILSKRPFQYTLSQYGYLKSLGITSNGFHPKSTIVYSGDSYIRPKFDLKISGLNSGIPSIEKYIQSLATGKVTTTVLKLMGIVISEVNKRLDIANFDECDPITINSEIARLTREKRALEFSLNSNKFILMARRRWGRNLSKSNKVGSIKWNNMEFRYSFNISDVEEKL